MTRARPLTRDAKGDEAYTALVKQNKVLLEALRPFALEADEWVDRVSDSYRPGLTEPRQTQSYAKAVFSMRDLRRARRLVAKATTLAGPSI